MKATQYTKTGVKKAEIALSKDIFEVNIRPEQLKIAYHRFYSNIRTNNARTLKRGEVSGGGKKPWRQKGTGRARFGSTRNPIWRHGGIAFGPTGDENYTKNMPKNMIRSSIKQALTVSADKIKVIESFSMADYSTKKAVELIDKVGAEGYILIVADKLDNKFIASARNIAGVKLLSARQLNVVAVLNADAILIDIDGLKALDEWLVGTKQPKTPAKKEAK